MTERENEAGIVVDVRAKLSNSAAQDAFGRLRTSLPRSIFAYGNQYGNTGLMVEQFVSGTGTSTHSANTSSVIMSTGGTASGAKCTRQTRQYFRYLPGKSFLVLQSGNFNGAETNVRKRRGYFDDDNGVYFEMLGTGIGVVLRSKSTGSVVNTRVEQANWNMDPMDGTGLSGVILDTSKVQILVIDLEWLGSGRIRYGFVIGGELIYCHQINNANIATTAYMTTANLPLRAEVENLGTTSTDGTMQIICATVMIEGDGDTGGFYDRSVSTGITSASISTRQAVISIRPKATFNGIVNRGTILLSALNFLVGTNDVYYEVIYNGTIGGTPVWNSAGANSIVEFDVAGTTVSGGEMIDCGFLAAGSGANRLGTAQDITSQYPLTLDHAGANPATLTVVCTARTGTSSVNACIDFKEYY